MTSEERYRTKTEGLAWRRVGEETVILNLDTSQYLNLNSTGSVLWETLSEAPASVDEMVARLLADFDVPADDARADVQDFVDRCMVEGLLAPA